MFFSGTNRVILVGENLNLPLQRQLEIYSVCKIEAYTPSAVLSPKMKNVKLVNNLLDIALKKFFYPIPLFQPSVSLLIKLISPPIFLHINNDFNYLCIPGIFLCT